MHKPFASVPRHIAFMPVGQTSTPPSAYVTHNAASKRAGKHVKHQTEMMDHLIFLVLPQPWKG